MIKKVLFGLGVVLWFFVVFLLTFWMSFPSGKAARQVEYRIQELSGGSAAAMIEGVTPWWVGVHASDVKLMQMERGEPKPLLAADDLWLRTSLFSLVSSNPSFSGAADVGGSRIWYDGVIAREDSGERLSKLSVEADSLSVGALGTMLAPLLGDGLSGKGDLALELDLEVPDGWATAEGNLALTGKNLTLTVAVPDPLGGDEPFALGPILVPVLDFELDVGEGRATVDKGLLRSNFANIELDGHIDLQNRFDRSRLRLDAVVSDLGQELQMFEGLMSKAKWNDDKYHYKIACQVSRMSGRCLRPDRQRRRRSSVRSRTRPEGPRSRPTPPTMDDDERAERRAELLEERRQRLAERRRERAEGRDDGPQRPGELDRRAIPLDRAEDEEMYDDEEPLDDEEGFDDELSDDELPDDMLDEPPLPPGEEEDFYDE